MLEELIEYLNKQIEDERDFYIEEFEGYGQVTALNDWELAESVGRYKAFNQVLKFVKSFENFKDW